MEYNIVVVEWVDALFIEKWLDEDDVSNWANRDEWINENTGWFVENSNKHIVIASERSMNDGKLKFNQLLKIPKSLVINMTFMRIDETTHCSINNSKSGSISDNEVSSINNAKF